MSGVGYAGSAVASRAGALRKAIPSHRSRGAVDAVTPSSVLVRSRRIQRYPHGSTFVGPRACAGPGGTGVQVSLQLTGTAPTSASTARQDVELIATRHASSGARDSISRADPHLDDALPLTRLEGGYCDAAVVVAARVAPTQQQCGLPTIGAVVPAVTNRRRLHRCFGLIHPCAQFFVQRSEGPIHLQHSVVGHLCIRDPGRVHVECRHVPGVPRPGRVKANAHRHDRAPSAACVCVRRTCRLSATAPRLATNGSPRRSWSRHRSCSLGAGSKCCTEWRSQSSWTSTVRPSYRYV